MTQVFSINDADCHLVMYGLISPEPLHFRRAIEPGMNQYLSNHINSHSAVRTVVFILE